MATVKFGYPNRTYFELFEDQHPSEKIYSVQVKDWEDYVKSENMVAAVVQLDMQQDPTGEADHLMVAPTADLIGFLNSRGIEVPDSFYVQQAAFTWEQDEIPDEYVAKKKNKNIKTILAAIAAAIAFLSN